MVSCFFCWAEVIERYNLATSMYPSLTGYPGIQNLEKLWKPHAWRIQAFPHMTKETLTKGPVTRNSVSRNVCTALSSVNLWCINLCNFCLGCTSWLLVLSAGLICIEPLLWPNSQLLYSRLCSDFSQFSRCPYHVSGCFATRHFAWLKAQGVYYCISNIDPLNAWFHTGNKFGTPGHLVALYHRNI
jgi:hypothetical protein